MKNTLNGFEFTREAKQALTDFFEQLRNMGDKYSVSSDSYEDLASSLDEHITFALRKVCDHKRVETVDAQSMLEVLQALGKPEELIEALSSQPIFEKTADEKKESSDQNEVSANEAIRFREYPLPQERLLRRSSKDRWIMGVCGGFAEYWGISSTLIRLLMVLSGIGPFAYIIIGLLMSSDNGDKAPTSRSTKPNKTLQTAMKGLFVVFMFIVLYTPLSLALLSVATAGFFKILSEVGIAGWQSNDLWFYFATGIPGYLTGLAGLVTGLGFFALLTQYFTTTFLNKSLLNFNTRKLITGVAAMGLIVLSTFWFISSSMREQAISESLSHSFAAANVSEIDLAFPGHQMPFYRKSMQLVGDPDINEIKVDVVRKVGGWSESYAATNLESMKYTCDLDSKGKLRLGGDIAKPAWSFYPYPEITFVIRVPEQQLLKINCNQRSGASCDIDIARVSGPVSIDLQTGKIKMESVSSPEISVKSEVGDMELQKIRAERFEVTSNVGKIQCSELYSANAAIKTGVGAIRVTDFEGGKLNISSEVGSVRLENFKSDEASIETRTGSINLKTNFLKAGSKLKVVSEVGSIRAELPENSNPDLKFESHVGRVNNAFKSQKATIDSPRILIKSNVGSIRVKKLSASKKASTKTLLPAEATED